MLTGELYHRSRVRSISSRVIPVRYCRGAAAMLLLSPSFGRMLRIECELIICKKAADVNTAFRCPTRRVVRTAE